MPRRRTLLVAAVGALLLLAGVALILGGGGWVEHHGLEVRCISDTVQPAGDGRNFVLLAGEPVELEIRSRLSLTALRLDFDSRAPSRLEAPGWRLGDRLFRPDGSIVFDLVPEVPAEPLRSWRPPWRPHYSYRLRFELPEAGGVPIALTLHGVEDLGSRGGFQPENP